MSSSLPPRSSNRDVGWDRAHLAAWSQAHFCVTGCRCRAGATVDGVAEPARVGRSHVRVGEQRQRRRSGRACRSTRSDGHVVPRLHPPSRPSSRRRCSRRRCSRRRCSRKRVPGARVPGDAVPGGAVPGSAVPRGAVPGGAVPGGVRVRRRCSTRRVEAAAAAGRCRSSTNWSRPAFGFGGLVTLDRLVRLDHADAAGAADAPFEPRRAVSISAPLTWSGVKFGWRGEDVRRRARDDRRRERRAGELHVAGCDDAGRTLGRRASTSSGPGRSCSGRARRARASRSRRSSSPTPTRARSLSSFGFGRAVDVGRADRDHERVVAGAVEDAARARSRCRSCRRPRRP